MFSGNSPEEKELAGEEIGISFTSLFRPVGQLYRTATLPIKGLAYGASYAVPGYGKKVRKGLRKSFKRTGADWVRTGRGWAKIARGTGEVLMFVPKTLERTDHGR